MTGFGGRTGVVAAPFTDHPLYPPAPAVRHLELNPARYSIRPDGTTAGVEVQP